MRLEHLAARQRVSELTDEFFKVVLHDAVQQYEFAVDAFDVVDDFGFDFGWRPHEVKRGTAREHFHVALIR